MKAGNPVNGQALAEVAPAIAAAARAERRIVDGAEMRLYPTDATLAYYGVRDPALR